MGGEREDIEDDCKVLGLNAHENAVAICGDQGDTCGLMIEWRKESRVCWDVQKLVMPTQYPSGDIDDAVE